MDKSSYIIKIFLLSMYSTNIAMRSLKCQILTLRYNTSSSFQSKMLIASHFKLACCELTLMAEED